MANLKSLLVQGAAGGYQAASEAIHYVRKQEFDEVVSGTSPLGHHHDATDIDGLIPLLLLLLQESRTDTASIEWVGDGTAADVRVKANGGIVIDPEGLSLDSDNVSQPGHHHAAADIDDFAAALFNQLKAIWKSSSSVEWFFNDPGMSGTGRVRLKPSSGLIQAPDGVATDFGLGTNQVARGDHSHAQLHDPVTFADSDTLQIVLYGQDIAAEVLLSALGGLKVVADGVAVDLGSGTNQVARGDHSHALLHNPVTATSDASLSLAIGGTSGQELTGTVRLDATPPTGGGRVGVSTRGIYVEMGIAADVAAPGDHGHDAATNADSGFMSATDKNRLDTLWGATPSGTLPPSGTMDVMNLRVLRFHNATTGQTRDIYLGNDGEMKGLTP